MHVWYVESCTGMGITVTPVFVPVQLSSGMHPLSTCNHGTTDRGERSECRDRGLGDFKFHANFFLLLASCRYVYSPFSSCSIRVGKINGGNIKNCLFRGLGKGKLLHIFIGFPQILQMTRRQVMGSNAPPPTRRRSQDFLCAVHFFPPKTWRPFSSSSPLIHRLILLNSLHNFTLPGAHLQLASVK